jgi:hypothetical protein
MEKDEVRRTYKFQSESLEGRDQVMNLGSGVRITYHVYHLLLILNEGGAGCNTLSILFKNESRLIKSPACLSLCLSFTNNF